jgi:hypothetical protein
MLLLARGMKMKTMTIRRTKSKQTKQELGRGEEENLWTKTRSKQIKQEQGKGEEKNMW